jgi:suppressor for copper-sensitivity B
MALLALLASLGGLAPAAWAADAASEWFTTDQGRVRLIAASPAVDGADGLSLGLEFRLASGWKIYWRSPGDAGYPPRLDWAGSTNLTAADVHWPAPRRFSVLGLETVGYANSVILPITARLERPGEAVHLQLALEYLTCSEICIPYETTLALDLPAGAAPAGITGYGALIARSVARVPGDGRSAGLSVQGAALLPGKTPMLELRVHAAQPLAGPDVFVEGPAGVAFGIPALKRGDEPGVSILHLRVSGDQPALDGLVGRPLTVTLVDGDRSVESTVSPAMGRPAADFAGLLPMLAVALLGGFILNFMPCVLPVLSLKLLGAVEHGGGSRRAVRLGFLATSAGVLLSFLALAGAMIALKSAGLAVGWGVQFQQPLFLIGMVGLLTLFACNLWGLFEVPMPSWLGGAGAIGQGRALLGNLAAGAFATLLATPCSAPFLGTAVGFALASGPFEILAIFVALGIGLAAPYLLVAALPRIALLLPRPGRWMVGLRRVLGAALAATALWLVSVLAAQIGQAAALAVAALMLVVALALAALRRPAARRTIAAGALAAALVLPFVGSPPAPVAGEGGEAFWRPFDRAAIASLVQDGRVVFVDVTADWCLTCQVNKRLVLDALPVRDRLHSPAIVAMRADWTRPDAGIAAYLRGFGRYGIPFNAVYGPGAPQGLPLSEILTPDQVLAALRQAAGARQVGDDFSRSSAYGAGVDDKGARAMPAAPPSANSTHGKG